MRYARIDYPEAVNGLGFGVSLFTQGCRFHCKNCFNSELWNYDGGNLWTKENENEIIGLLNQSGIARLSILGGEPLSPENIDDLTSLLKRVKKELPNKRIWLYSGFEYDKIDLELIKYVDVLVDGKFVEELKDYTLKFRGSKNQRLVNVQKSLQANKIILWEER